MTELLWDRRLAAQTAALPEGVTPPGTRGRILHAALKLFADFGFYGASIRHIAESAGIRSATLYAHYPSKEHILAELIRLGHEELYTRLRRAVVHSGANPASQLAAIARTHVLTHCDFPLLAVVANNDLHALSSEQAAPAVTLRSQAQQLLLDIVNHGVETGDFDVPDVLLVATALSSMGMRVANWFGPGQAHTPEQIADTYAELALRMVGAKTRGND